MDTNTLFTLSKHAQAQARRRGISQRSLQLIIDFGEFYWAGSGSNSYYLSKRKYQWLVKHKRLSSDEIYTLRDVISCAVIASDQTIITVMHAPRPPKHWRAA